MSIEHLHSPFLGIPLKASSCRRSYVNLDYVVRRSKLCCSSPIHGKYQTLSFSQFGGRKLDFSKKLYGPRRSNFKANCIEERFSRSKALIRSVVPGWKEGLLLVRCSVFVAVISAVGLLVWYGQMKAKYYMESRLLPSVCSFMSEYLQRELEFGKIRNVSPLSITLESSSIGPHHEEFSCGEVPKMKIRVRPFASLKRGKIVVDAVLSRPSVMIAQKDDFTWLGIPTSEAPLQRHSSTEEGIDHRTRTRRVARETMAACWAKERDNAAREAAEKGYMVSGQSSSSSADEECKDVGNMYNDLSTSDSSVRFDEHMHLGDHHFIDTGIEHKLKHAELEKSFDLKSRGSGFKLWSGRIPGPMRRAFKRKSNGKETREADCAAKRRLLERSAAAALAHFRDLSILKLSDLSQWGISSIDGNHTAAELENLSVKSKAANGQNIVAGEDLHAVSGNQYVPLDTTEEQNFEQRSSDATDGDINNKRETNLLNNNENKSGYGDTRQNEHLTVDKDSSGKSNSISFEGEPCVLGSDEQSNVKLANGQQPSSVSFPDSVQTDNCNVKNEASNEIYVDKSKSDVKASSNSLQNHRTESLDDKYEDRNGSSYLDVSPVKCRPWLAMPHSVRMWPLSLKSDFPFSPRSAGELLYDFVAGKIEKVKSCMNSRLDDLVAELAEEVDAQPEGIEKMLPVTLDSVYFTGGTLMLLGYGDRESREMGNVSGHVKFQNHYSRVHVQLAGNCKEWRSDTTEEGGGWLSTDVVVDCIDQHWRANLKIANLFVPLFERILDIPIMWSKGRATGELHICMTSSDTFPNLHGQLDVKEVAFQIYDAPSCFTVHCLEVAEEDALKLEATQSARYKQEADEAVAAKDELVKAKSDTEKLAMDTELARAVLAEELVKVKADLADLQKTADAVTGEWDRLNEVVKQVNDEKDELSEAKLLVETDVEVKDVYIRHLAFMLDPQLSLLHVEVADEIRSIPTVFDVEVVPQKYELPQNADKEGVAANVEGTSLE